MNTNFKNTAEDINNFLSGHRHEILTALIIAYRETGTESYKESAKMLNKMLSDTKQTHYADINRELNAYSWRKMAIGNQKQEVI